MSEKYLLAADVGGTKTNMAVFSSLAGIKKPHAEVSLKNREFPNFASLVDQYLKGNETQIDGICVGVAGPVVKQRVQVTNLPWVIDVGEISRNFGIDGVWLINDLEAVAYSVLKLATDDFEVLSKGEPVEHGSVAIIAPGTGLGEAFLTWDGTQYQAHATEGGHTDFGPTTARQKELLEYLLERMDRVSYEKVCSGIGIPNLYAFLRDRGYAKEPDWLAGELDQSSDPTPLIVNTATDEDKDVPLCTMTLELFVTILGAEAGNLALKTLAKGGIYIGGGIPPRILPWLKSKRFLDALQNKGSQSPLVERMPVRVILNPKAALTGAGIFGLRRLEAQ